MNVVHTLMDFDSVGSTGTCGTNVYIIKCEKNVVMK